MASFKIYLLMMVFLMFLTTQASTNARPMQRHVCLGLTAALEFEKTVLYNKTVVVKWYFKAWDYSDYVLIAGYHDGDLKLQNKYRNKITSENDILKLKNAEEEDSGLYKRECIYNDNGAPYEDYLELTVIVPPDGPPTFNDTTSQDKKKILICLEPSFPGSPKSFVMVTDSNGKIMPSAEVTDTNDHYRCCLYGDALKCMNSSINICSISHSVGDVSVSNCNGLIGVFVSFFTISVGLHIVLVGSMIYKRNRDREPIRGELAYGRFKDNESQASIGSRTTC